MSISAPIPTLWFDDQAEHAAELYAAAIPNSRVVEVTRYPDVGQDITGKAPGSVMTVEMEINGSHFVLLNGGPHFTFDEAISFMLEVETQAEIDALTEKLIADGGEQGPCGWVKDRFGLSWQIAPRRLTEMFRHDDREAVNRAMAAMLEMRKLDIAALEAAYSGKAAAPA